MGMIDISEKPVVRRQAEAEGKIILSPGTIDVIRDGRVVKGDPFAAAEIAAMTAAKQTYLLIPHCHQIPLDTVRVDFDTTGKETITVRCRVKATARTGVEMEALVGVTAALNTVWDMVKYLEKDDEGQYPGTKMTDIRVTRKLKEEL